jgi:magnesium chelatase family protein
LLLPAYRPVANHEDTRNGFAGFCRLDSAGEQLLKMAITSLGLSALAYHRILKVGMSISDFAHSTDIRLEHEREAIQNRTLDRPLWQV